MKLELELTEHQSRVLHAVAHARNQSLEAVALAAIDGSIRRFEAHVRTGMADRGYDSSRWSGEDIVAMMPGGHQ